jgi:hypothetical protein
MRLRVAPIKMRVPEREGPLPPMEDLPDLMLRVGTDPRLTPHHCHYETFASDALVPDAPSRQGAVYTT